MNNYSYGKKIAPDAPTGYEFYGNSSAADTKKQAIRNYSIYGCGVYLIKDLIAIKNPYFQGYSVFNKRGARNHSCGDSWRYDRVKMLKKRFGLDKISGKLTPVQCSNRKKLV